MHIVPIYTDGTAGAGESRARDFRLPINGGGGGGGSGKGLIKK